MKSIELFSGAGGLALGVSKAGFDHLAVIERDKYSCDTIRENQALGLEPLTKWGLIEGDVVEQDFSVFPEGIDLIAGGPPCQPFSLGGKHRGHLDSRDMFPQSIRAVRELKPRAFLFENVRGLTRQAFFNYFQYILLQLEYPDVIMKVDEEWEHHYKRLQEYKFSGLHCGLHYNVHAKVLNAANYGIPQRRERVFVVGFRSDLGIRWSYPEETHSHKALIRDQWVTEKYWERHEVPKRRRPSVSQRNRRAVSSLEFEALTLQKPWVTVRDVISDLPDPRLDKCAREIPNHRFQPGARSYPGHTGSPLDEPAKTLKAGDHGVPGGENMLRHPNGRVRYFTVRESARLQTFPDNFLFHGSWTETMRQLGNAVPVDLAQIVASSIKTNLSRKKRSRKCQT